MTSAGSRPRLADVAAVAGVSQKTVSNVVNGFVHVSEATRTRVLAAIDEVGYRPNLSARNLARGRSGTIALVVPRLEMPYFAALAGRILERADARDWFVLIHETGSQRAAEIEALESRFPQRIDGILLSAEHLTAADLAARRDTTPLVLLGAGPEISGAPRVTIDDESAAHAAVTRLARRGCRRIAMIGARAEDETNRRLAGYRRALHEHALAFDPALVLPVHGNFGEEGERAVTELLAGLDDGGAAPPDGIFAVTDWVALGALRALHEHGLAVPSDVAVIGFDDIPYARVAVPSLSTVSPDRTRIAEAALRLLEEQLGGDGAEAGGRGTGSRGEGDGATGAEGTAAEATFALIERESTARS